MQTLDRSTRPRQLDESLVTGRLLQAGLSIGRPSTWVALHRLVASGKLIRLQRDAYVSPETLTARPLQVANALRSPSYISLFTALAEEGMTTQNPREIQSVVYGRAKEIAPAGSPLRFTYATVPKRAFTGFVLRDGVFVAEPEKALLDLLYLYGLAFDVASIDLAKLRLPKLRRYVRLFPARVQRDLTTLLPRV